ncbi:hypothetical protein E0485_04405 [Paenibacillus albiflavus]|uniref:F-type H+-transporting ATPase subunit beta n=1 Tax=Paenibacillus albiflavus TaxID=2545760 RepID=A0A4R4EP62_9BACL|nr:hypothetical protein [Paenibacillus albiflavus]TCZ80245.1 hypothetical protein E0485_04405 [Paenibacillus albiflavus]
MEDLQLNVALLRKRVPNLTTAAKNVGLRPATVSNLCTGKIPIGRAEVRTLVTLANLAGCTLDELILRGGRLSMIETGIKVLDLFAPLVRGGTMGIIARPGMGQLVMLGELFRRVKQRSYVTILWLPKELVPGIEDCVNEAEHTCSSIDELASLVMDLRAQHDVFIGADRSTVLSGELAALRERIQMPGVMPVTIALVDCAGESVDEDAPYGPLDTLWKFDMDLSTRHFFPAVNPIASTSIILEGAQLEANHLAVQGRARKLMRRYRELRPLVMAKGIESLTGEDKMMYERGERLEAYFTQPFYIAEPYTGKAGVSVSLQETIENVQGIMDGVADHYDIKELTYIGKLSK